MKGRHVIYHHEFVPLGHNNASLSFSKPVLQSTFTQRDGVELGR